MADWQSTCVTDFKDNYKSDQSHLSHTQRSYAARIQTRTRQETQIRIQNTIILKNGDTAGNTANFVTHYFLTYASLRFKF